MQGYLVEILHRKWVEIEEMEGERPYVEPLAPTEGKGHSFSMALKEKAREEGVALIAEIKRKSPSKGKLAALPDPRRQAEIYRMGGAAALSILTDGPGFGGSFRDLAEVAAQETKVGGLPILCKEFILHPIQVRLAAETGASACLLIASILGKELQEMLRVVHLHGLEALVEVHTEEEVTLALEAGATCVGVNNRDLETFSIDLGVAERLGALLPKSIVRVAESGIQGTEDLQRMVQAGFSAVLVGEALVSSSDPLLTMRELKKGARRWG